MTLGCEYTSERRVIASCTIFLAASRGCYRLPELLLGIMAIWCISKVSELAASGRWKTAVWVAMFATLSVFITQSPYLQR